jgi:hypothetical protein
LWLLSSSASIRAGVFAFWGPPFGLTHLFATFAKDPADCATFVQCNPFRITTYKTDAKQTTLTIFRINTYGKPGGGGNNQLGTDREHP